jgi:hypothetical protein
MTYTQLVERNCRNYELRRLAEQRTAATRALPAPSARAPRSLAAARAR